MEHVKFLRNYYDKDSQIGTLKKYPLKVSAVRMCSLISGFHHLRCVIFLSNFKNQD